MSHADMIALIAVIISPAAEQSAASPELPLFPRPPRCEPQQPMLPDQRLTTNWTGSVRSPVPGSKTLAHQPRCAFPSTRPFGPVVQGEPVDVQPATRGIPLSAVAYLDSPGLSQSVRKMCLLGIARSADPAGVHYSIQYQFSGIDRSLFCC